MTTLTPARIAAIRAKNADRPPAEWPDRYLVDELLDALVAQQQEIARSRLHIRAALTQLERQGQKGPVQRALLAALFPAGETLEDAKDALREAVPDA